MAWAKFDDGYPRHRKVWPLSDAAFRLDTSGICWSGEALTDGRIPADELTAVSPVKQPRKAAAELVRRGRWHEPGHDCPRCPPISDGWVIHDYLDYNPDADKVLATREARAKAGQRGGRASARQREAGQQSPPNPVAQSKQIASGLLSNGGADDRATGPAKSNPVPLPVVGKGSTAAARGLTRARETAAAAAESDEIGQLRDACTEAGMPVRWDKLGPGQRERIAALVGLHGVDRLVQTARSQWRPDNPAGWASAWLGHWEALPAPGRRLTAVPELCQDPAHVRQPMPCRLCAADRKAAG